MSELKSAREVAQERANRLGKLSAQEKEQQERQRYHQIGQALAQKWLDGPQGADIAAELGNQQEEGREMIKQALIERLIEAVGFADTQAINNAKRIIEAVSSLKPELQSRTEELGQLVQEYKLAEQKMRQELESRYAEILHRLRISGTAVDAINIEDNPRWQLARQELAEAFASRLKALRQALIS